MTNVSVKWTAHKGAAFTSRLVRSLANLPVNQSPHLELYMGSFCCFMRRGLPRDRQSAVFFYREFPLHLAILQFHASNSPASIIQTPPPRRHTLSASECDLTFETRPLFCLSRSKRSGCFDRWGWLNARKVKRAGEALTGRAHVALFRNERKSYDRNFLILRSNSRGMKARPFAGLAVARRRSSRDWKAHESGGWESYDRKFHFKIKVAAEVGVK